MRITPPLDVNRAPRHLVSLFTSIALALAVVKFSAVRKYGPPNGTAPTR